MRIESDVYTEQRRRLATLFPRGGFKRDTDLTCIITAGRGRDAGAHLFEHTPEEVVGLFYFGGSCRYLRALKGLVLRHLAGDGEGILHLAWSAELAERLPAFSRGRPRGRRFVPAARRVLEASALAGWGA